MFQIEEIKKIVGDDNVRCEEPLSKHTTFRIGGNAKVFAAPEYIEDFVKVLDYIRKEEQPYFIMGNGSNLLAYDTGYDGVIVSTHMPNHRIGECEGKMALDALMVLEPGDVKRKMLPELSEDVSHKTVVVAGSGIMLSTFANTIGKAGLAGFEFASGIPGTLGGAVTMNAGAYGGEIKDCILGAMVLEENGQQKYLHAKELKLGYRSSVIQRENMIVLWAAFAFEHGDASEIEQMMRELNQRRRDKQPLQYGSAGSTFKRPEGHFAGKLIEDAGLKGYRVGDIMVSDKHCGFVVNVGEGTYDEARQVIEHVQKVVKEKFDIELELEVRKVQ